MGDGGVGGVCLSEAEVLPGWLSSWQAQAAPPAVQTWVSWSAVVVGRCAPALPVASMLQGLIGYDTDR